MHLPRLEALVLRRGSVDHTVVQALEAAGVSCLRRLEVVGCSMDDAGAAALRSSSPRLLRMVELLNLSCRHVTDETVVWLAGVQLPALRVLQLEGPSSAPHLTDTAVRHIAGAPWLSQLSELSFSGQGQLGFNPDPWNALGERPPGSLRRLNLSACHGMGVAVAAELGRADWVVRLERLEVWGWPVEALEMLRDMLPSCPARECVLAAMDSMAP